MFDNYHHLICIIYCYHKKLPTWISTHPRRTQNNARFKLKYGAKLIPISKIKQEYFEGLFMNWMIGVGNFPNRVFNFNRIYDKLHTNFLGYGPLSCYKTNMG